MPESRHGRRHRPPAPPRWRSAGALVHLGLAASACGTAPRRRRPRRRTPRPPRRSPSSQHGRRSRPPRRRRSRSTRRSGSPASTSRSGRHCRAHRRFRRHRRRSRPCSRTPAARTAASTARSTSPPPARTPARRWRWTSRAFPAARRQGIVRVQRRGPFTFDDAVLTIGLAENQQAIVPLTATRGRRPSPRSRSRSTRRARAPPTRLELELLGGEFRADQPWNHGQMKDGTFVLTAELRRDLPVRLRGWLRLHRRERRPQAARRHHRRHDPGRRQPVDRAHRARVHGQGPVLAVRDRGPGQPATTTLLVRSFDDALDEIPFTIQ